jgi:hypothetical protein
MIDDLPPLPSDIRGLVDADRRADDPMPEEARRRILRGVGAAVLAGGATTVAISTAAAVKGTTAAGLLSSVLGFFGRKSGLAATAFVVGGATGAGGYAVTSQIVNAPKAAETCPPPVAAAPGPRAPSPAHAVVSPVASASVAAESEAPSEEPLAVASVVKPIVAASVVPSSGTDRLLASARADAEAANAALLRGEPAQALAAADRCAARPGTPLAQECEFLAIRALARLGRDSDARVRAGSFRARHPNSFYLPAIDALLTGSKPSP